MRRIRRKLKKPEFPSSESTSGEGSFHSRQSTTSTITTAEISGEQGSSSVTTEGMEIPVQETKHLESLMFPCRLRRFKPRWGEDYGRKNEMNSGEIGHFTLKCKPFRAHCFINCSLEKIGSNVLTGQRIQGTATADREPMPLLAGNKCCDQYFHNPKTQFCEFFLKNSAENRTGAMIVHAVVEGHPNQTVGI